MVLKPGWLIAFFMFWVVLQLLITIGYAVTYGDSSNYGQGYIATGEAGTTQQTVGIGDADSPIMKILIVTQEWNSTEGILSTNWGIVLSSLWQMMTFQAPFLSGSWAIVSIFFSCIYAGLGISILFTFAPAAMAAVGNAVGGIARIFH